MFYGLLLLTLVLTLFAQYRVNATYKKYEKVLNKHGYTGADVAKRLLEQSGAYDVSVEMVGGHLTDHYDPRTKVLRLSQGVHQGTSVAALGVAAHETGHAIQDQNDYVFLRLRSVMVPVTNIGSNLAMPLVFIGILLTSFGSSSFGYTLMQFGVLLFAVVVAFTLVTLPVEFDASRRAVEMLGEERYLDDEELHGAKKVLSAAAFTYVAAAAVAIANLLRLLAIIGFRRD